MVAFDRMTALVVTALVAVSWGELHAFQDQSTPRKSAQVRPASGAQTPGSVALLADRSDAGTLEQLRIALSHADPVVRAVAARVAGVSRLIDLAPAIGAALGQERDETAAAEEVRALLFFESNDAWQSVERHLPRAGAPAVRAFLEWLLRKQPERFANKIEELLRPLPAAEITDFGPLMLAAAREPAIREGVLRAWLHVAPAMAWRLLLEQLAAEIGANDVAVFQEALDSRDSSTRQETVWAIVTRLAVAVPVADAVVEKALSFVPSSEVQASTEATWERFGRELVARRIQRAATPDRADLIRREALRHEWDARRLPLLDEVSQEERAALRSTLGEKIDENAAQLRRISPRPPLTQPTIRTIPIPWPRFLASLLDGSRCKVSNDPRVGAVRITYRPDGRLASAQVDLGNLPTACEPALAALARLTLADVNFPIARETQLLILPVSNDFVSCVNDGIPGTVRRLDEPGAHIDTPRKTRDVRPVYPDIAQQARVSGVVVMEGTISATGCVMSVHVVRSDNPLLELAALTAVMRWQFTPTRVDGQPVAVRMTVTCNFNLK